MVEYQIQFHSEKITQTPILSWSSNTPFMVPQVGSYVDLWSGTNQSMEVKEIVYQLTQTDANTLLEVVFVII